jgi:hypothetical protein
MVKSTMDKKLILGSALAGLILAGPGLSVTATPTGGKFFQTAQLASGYRLAQAEEKKPAATPAPAPPATPAPSSGTIKQSDTPTTKGDPMPSKGSGGYMKCGAGSCG